MEGCLTKSSSPPRRQLSEILAPRCPQPTNHRERPCWPCSMLGYIQSTVKYSTLTPLGRSVKDMAYTVEVSTLSAVRDVFPTKGA